MTRKAFWSDPYASTLATKVARVDGTTLALEDTIFYAFSGGQESDRGTIAGRAVLEAVVAGADIEYTLAEGHGLREGDEVTVAIDWARRYALMRLHSAAELTLQLMYRTFPGIYKIGAHIAPDKARLDFEFDGSVSSALPAISARIDEIVGADIAIECGYIDAGLERRFWRSGGFGPVPCCGTHPRRSSELGGVILKRRNPGKGKERIELTLAD